MRALRREERRARGIDIKPSAFTDAVGSIADREFVRAQMQGVTAVLHTATLHKPHVGTHSRQEFIDTNVSGTLALLEEGLAAGVRSFVFTSTTSAFGSALTPAPGQPAAWVTENGASIPKNIYGVTKVMAESLCELFFRKWKLPVLVLRTSRFFPEPDDDPSMRERFETANAQANEMLYRRVDVEDIVAAHFLAMHRAPEIGFARYIISATTPFTQNDLALLRSNAPEVVRQLYPDFESIYAARGWSMFPEIDRVYVNEAARRELGWQPKYDFRHVLNAVREGADFRSPLAREIGSKGYHSTVFEDGPYPVA